MTQLLVAYPMTLDSKTSAEEYQKLASVIDETITMLEPHAGNRTIKSLMMKKDEALLLAQSAPKMDDLIKERMPELDAPLPDPEFFKVTMRSPEEIQVDYKKRQAAQGLKYTQLNTYNYTRETKELDMIPTGIVEGFKRVNEKLARVRTEVLTELVNKNLSSKLDLDGPFAGREYDIQMGKADIFAVKPILEEKD